MKLENILSKLEPEEQSFVSALIDKDPLTGVYNRRKFERDIELLVAMSKRTERGSGLLIIDIDHFKRYNDEFGHRLGDRVLKEVSRCLEKSLRKYDKIHLYRYGGEEFVIIIPDVTTKEAFNIGERVRRGVKSSCPVTISIGISHYMEISDNRESLIAHADHALYDAKRGGRDRVVIYERRS